MNYKQAYFQLAGAVANVIESLTNAQIEAEKIVINQPEKEVETKIISFPPQE